MDSVLPGLEATPERAKVRQGYRLDEEEARRLKTFRWERKQMERRTEAQKEHVLANLSKTWGKGPTRLHRELNSGRMGKYSRALVRELIQELIDDGKVKMLCNGRYVKC